MATIHRYNLVGTGISLTAATARTVAAILPGTTRAIQLLGINIGFDSTTTTDAGVLIEVVRSDGTTAGTSTTTAPVSVVTGIPAPISGGRTAYTVEPTVLTTLWATRMTPIGSTIILPFPPDREIQYLASGANGILGVRLTAPQAQSNLVVTLEFCE